MHVVVFLFAVITLVCVLIWKRHRTHLSCQDLIERMYPLALGPVEALLNGNSLGGLWEGNGGYGGLWRLWRNHLCLLRLCQLHGQHKSELIPQLIYVGQRATWLRNAAIVSALRAPIRSLWPDNFEVQVIHVLEAYRDLAYRAHSLFGDDSPECAKRLVAVL